MEKKKISDFLQEQKGNWFDDYVVANAPLIMAVFANFVVIFADYRAYDVIFKLTGIWWKALAASLACAIPFILWEIGWQYNHTTDNWRIASLVMAGLAFGTSVGLGIADYVGFTSAWADMLLAGVVVLTGIHTVMGFLYYYNDPDVARRRRKAQALGKMQDEQLNAEVARTLLEDGDSLLGLLSQLEQRYEPEEVQKIIAMLQGRRINAPEKQRKPQQQPRPAYAQHTQQPRLDEHKNSDQESRPTIPPRENR